MSTGLEDSFTRDIVKNAIAEIYCNGDKLTLYECEAGDLLLEGRFGVIGKNENASSIQQVAKDLQSIMRDGRTMLQMIEDIRRRKMYVEMERVAQTLLQDEIHSIKKEMKSEIVVGRDDRQVSDFRRGGCKPFRALYKRDAEIDELQYPEAAYWAYVTGVGIYFGAKESRDEMRKGAIAELKTLCKRTK
jgi:hypothetical protein